MNIIDRARDALKGATPGPWRISGGQSVVGIRSDDWDGDDCARSNRTLAALAPEIAAEAVRLHTELGALADKLKAEGERLGNSAYVHERAEGAGYAAAAAQLVAALEGAEE